MGSLSAARQKLPALLLTSDCKAPSKVFQGCSVACMLCRLGTQHDALLNHEAVWQLISQDPSKR